MTNTLKINDLVKLKEGFDASSMTHIPTGSEGVVCEILSNSMVSVLFTDVFDDGVGIELGLSSDKLEYIGTSTSQLTPAEINIRELYLDANVCALIDYSVPITGPDGKSHVNPKDTLEVIRSLIFNSKININFSDNEIKDALEKFNLVYEEEYSFVESLKEDIENLNKEISDV